MLAAYFLASAAKQGKLNLATDIAKAMSQFAPGVAAEKIIHAGVAALRGPPEAPRDVALEEDSGEIPLMGPGEF